jgi:hypothetical protein
MIRKLALTFAAVAALGTASLAVTPTPASAGWKGKHGHHGHFHRGFRFYAGDYGYYDGCLKRVWVVNRFGEEVLRTVNVCY